MRNYDTYTMTQQYSIAFLFERYLSSCYCKIHIIFLTIFILWLISLLFAMVKSHCYIYLSFRCRNPFLGSTQFQWLSIGHDLSLWKVSVAADYSDSVPDSSNYMTNGGYHPLEELKVCKKVWETKLTSAETARTTVEVCIYSSCVVSYFWNSSYWKSFS